jgi:cytidylate kinase-like protein
VGVWTISADEGTGGERVAAELASAGGVPLLDRDALAVLAHDLEPELLEVEELRDVESHVVGRLNLVAMSLAMPAGSAAPDVVRELRVRRALPDLGRAVGAAAARQPAVILATAAFATIPDHPSAVHARLSAPFEWRVERYAARCIVDRRCAEQAVKHDDQRRRGFVRSLYHVDLDDDSHFSLVLDASRFSVDRLVGILLAAGGR